MGWFNKTDLQKVIELIRKDEAAVSELEAKLGSVEGEWDRLQGICEEIAAARLAAPSTYQRGTCESLFQARDAKLEAVLKKAVARRDSISGTLPEEIHAAKDKLQHRKQVLTNAFRTWSDVISPKLPEAMRGDLQEARKSCSVESDVETICSFISDWSQRVADENAGTTVALLDWRNLANRVAAA